jgi:histidine phosphotransferase ChpT
MPQELALSRPQLAQLLGARLTHDLAGPLGTIMAASGSAEGAALLGETVAELRLRMRHYAVVFGEAEAMSWADMQALLAGAPGAHRVAFGFEFAPQTQLDPALAQIVLAAAMLGAEALPRGGTLRIMPMGGAGLVVLPEGRLAAWPHALIERLAGMAPAEADTPRALLAPWLIALAEAARCRLSLGMGQPGVPPLLLDPQG